jgi:NAD+ dependent glucose-6-phosphate dehydrogenase
MAAIVHRSPWENARREEPMAKRKTVLVTGACGYVAGQLLPDLRRRYALRMVDVRTTDRRGRRVPGVVVADLADPDRDRYARLFRGVDAVVHFGYRPPEVKTTGVWGADPGALETFEGELLNVRMAQNVYRSALDAGVRRVVAASSNHAADWYEHALIHRGRKDLVSPDELPLSDNFYGWSKAAYELLGFVYASGSLGRQLEVVLLRIGAPRDVSARRYLGKLVEQHVGPGASGRANFKRDLGAWLSLRDLRQLVRRAIETRDVRDAHGVPWVVAYGISRNTRAFWSLESARRVLGYAPEDDSEVAYGRDVRRLLTGSRAPVRDRRGGL